MKILAGIILPPHLSVSGAARAAERLSAALTRYCDVAVASMGASAGKSADLAVPARFRRLPVKVRNPLDMTKRLNWFRTLFYKSDIPKLLQRDDYNIVHLHNPIPAIEMMRVAHACREAGVPYVISTHGFVEVANAASFHGITAAQRLTWWLLVEWPVRSVVRNASGIFALSPSDIPIVEGFGFTGKWIEIVPNGVDLPVGTHQRLSGDASVYCRSALRSRRIASASPASFWPTTLSTRGWASCLRPSLRSHVPIS